MNVTKIRRPLPNHTSILCSQYTPRQLDITRIARSTAQTSQPGPAIIPAHAHATRPTVSLHRRGVFAEHEHWFLALSIQLFEKYKRLLLQSKTSLLIAKDDIQGVILPIGVDVVFLEGRRENLFAWVIHGDAEGFEDFDWVGVVGLAVFGLWLLGGWVVIVASGRTLVAGVDATRASWVVEGSWGGGRVAHILAVVVTLGEERGGGGVVWWIFRMRVDCSRGALWLLVRSS